MSWRKYLIIPQLIWHGVRAPKDQTKAWDHFWSRVRKTGPGGEVLWDAASQAELDTILGHLDAHMDRALPVVDVGCGNGRFSRLLAARFPKVLGIDAAPSAIEHARNESRAVANVSFRVADAAAPDAGAQIASELGDANVFIRGVLHVLTHERRLAFVENLRAILGARGTLYFTETNIEGNPLDHLEFQGATLTSMPDPLYRCVAAGIRPPDHFGEAQLHTYFPADRWEILDRGKTAAHGVPLHPGVEREDIPSFFALVRPRG